MEYRNNEFPLHVFPETLQALILDRNEVLSWDINTFATLLLSASASVIGRNGLINVEEYDDLVPPIFWVVIIGETGTGKTPMLNLAFKYLKQKHAQSLKLSAPLIKAWDDEKPKNRVGSRPRPTLYLISDFTPETVVIDHSTNLRGLAIVVDEIASFILGMDQYKGGGKGQKEKTIEWFNGGNVESVRVNGVSFLEKSCINIVGGIQPSKMNLIINDDTKSDGFAMRFLFVELPVVPLYKSLKKPDKRLTENMLSLFRKVDIFPKTVFVLSAEAEKIEYNYYNEQITKSWKNTTMRGVNSKLSGYYLFRVCVVIELLEHADKGTKGNVISADTMNKAIELVEYFRTENLRQYNIAIAKDKIDKHPLANELAALMVYKTLEFDKVYTNQELIKAFEGVWKVDNMNVRKLPNKDLFIPQKHGHYKKAYDDAE